MSPLRPTPLRGIACTVALLAALAAPSLARASDAPAEASRTLERMRGRVCTVGTCAPRPPGALRQLAGFGTAVGLCVLAARRRPSDRD